MTLQHTAAFGLRARRGWSVATLTVALATVVGCSHNRQSYRPIYATPAAAASAPCTNCGSRATVTTEEPVSAPTSSVPVLSAPSTMNSTVPAPSAPLPGASGSVNSTVEPPPTAKPGAEPPYDEIPSPTMQQRNSGKPPGSNKSSSPGPAPALIQPNSGSIPQTQNSSTPTQERLAAAASPTVRRAGWGDRLRPFLAESTANELFYPNKVDRPWRYIVLHHSAAASGNLDQIDNEHRKILGYDGCGYHFIIGNGQGSGDGQIEVAQRWNNQKQGVHCRNARSHDVDEYGIGICLVGDLDRQPPTPRQVAAAQALIGYLGQRYHIESGHIATHAHLAATPTVCPGKFFPTQSILAAIQDAPS
ncbi:MAG TPA: N-acetylmuramoyl-L-alanine amidase, partial [Isosphaeraceae bacterium]|nr:N-acetylmuramoyl-L-alanine amidase [Isosphaeraceae bacterium]